MQPTHAQAVSTVERMRNDCPIHVELRNRQWFSGAQRCVVCWVLVISTSTLTKAQLSNDVASAFPQWSPWLARLVPFIPYTMRVSTTVPGAEYCHRSGWNDVAPG